MRSRVGERLEGRLLILALLRRHSQPVTAWQSNTEAAWQQQDSGHGQRQLSTED